MNIVLMQMSTHVNQKPPVSFLKEGLKTYFFNYLYIQIKLLII